MPLKTKLTGKAPAKRSTKKKEPARFPNAAEVDEPPPKLVSEVKRITKSIMKRRTDKTAEVAHEDVEPSIGVFRKSLLEVQLC